jgi:hypothetical protein
MYTKKHIYETAENTKTYYKIVEENPLKHVGNHIPFKQNITISFHMALASLPAFDQFLSSFCYDPHAELRTNAT